MKIYTRTGDDGSTGLLGAGRVLKSSPRVEAYGSVDELNATLGVVRALDAERWIDASLANIQARLFQVGAELATTDPGMLERVERVSDDDVAEIEAWIDQLELQLAPLKSFILPDGTLLATQLHLARTVCRRAERRVVALGGDEAVSPVVVRYLNRLADLLFVQARFCNARGGRVDTAWRGRKT
jgi:cob(I)alamin adenosyltransferase